ncbi:unnamed protein product [Staurois parvus]|uniref:Uncharacterized protein n=1 Tax=Staurois parvus TaxID=386267 RepID=A0ABN9F5U9_9NEOB|nr:unnamed protein product [Staurois parvus]
MRSSGSVQRGDQRCAVSLGERAEDLCPVSATCQCPSVPCVSAHPCHLPVPISHMCHISVPNSAHQCHISVPI